MHKEYQKKNQLSSIKLCDDLYDSMGFSITYTLFEQFESH